MPINNSNLLAGLTQAATIFYNEMVRKLQSGGYPQGDANRNTVSIDAATSIKPPQLLPVGGYIDVVIDVDKAPYAGAFEWGSGIHGSQGSVYPIVAKNVPNLVFWWEKKQKWFVGPQLPIGHPGIVAKPYIEPSIQATKNDIVSVINTSFMDQIILDLQGSSVTIDVKI